tara:strand:+ start:37 stop:336 length:300 start_codon:yes stop_codon:yes gene_type:complete
MKGSRAQAGQIFISHKGKLIPTSVGSPAYDATYGGDIDLQYFPRTLGTIPSGFRHRPDLISNLFLDTPNMWWVICERNVIFDIFEQLKPGAAIQIPTSL